MSKTLTVLGVARNNRNPFGEWLNKFAQLRRQHPHACHASSTDEELAIKFAKVVHEQQALTPGLPQTAVIARVLEDRINLRLVCTVPTDGCTPSEVVGCYAVVDGELVGLICLEKGKGSWLLNSAEGDGAERLDHYANIPLQRHLLKRPWWTLVDHQSDESNGRAVLYWQRRPLEN